MRPLPISTLFPYTTLFRSTGAGRRDACPTLGTGDQGGSVQFGDRSREGGLTDSFLVRYQAIPTPGRMQNAECRMRNGEEASKVAQRLSSARRGPQNQRLRAPADQKSASHLGRSFAEMPQRSGLDKLGYSKTGV